jgi:uncharacterized damage-inducible protein DinB
MDLLDRLLAHDAWTTAQLLAVARTLPDEHLDKEFDVGRKTLRATFHHIIRNMEVWTDCMTGDLPPRDTEADQSAPQLAARLDIAAVDLAAFARSIRERGAWDELWTDPLDDRPTVKSFGGAIAHVITHSMHHRAQILYMLRRLGVRDLPEGDVLSWESAVQHPD